MKQQKRQNKPKKKPLPKREKDIYDLLEEYEDAKLVSLEYYMDFGSQQIKVTYGLN